jgi:hypothetical protein
VTLKNIESNLSAHIEQRKRALPEMQASIVDAFG